MDLQVDRFVENVNKIGRARGAPFRSCRPVGNVQVRRDVEMILFLGDLNNKLSQTLVGFISNGKVSAVDDETSALESASRTIERPPTPVGSLPRKVHSDAVEIYLWNIA